MARLRGLLLGSVSAPWSVYWYWAWERRPPTCSTVVTYYYDGKNRRVKKDLASGTDVLYLNDGWQELEEREWDTNGEGAEDDKWEPRRQYVYGAIYIDEPLIFDKDTDNDGVCDDARYFYCQQANWNVVAVTDSSGAAAERIKYDPYGEATVTVQPGHSSTGNPYLFQGRRWDSEANLYYFRNRVYSPVLGRFCQRDSEGYVNGMSLYEYAGSTPCMSTDPWGEYLVSIPQYPGGPVFSVEIPAPCGAYQVDYLLFRTRFECVGNEACCRELGKEIPESLWIMSGLQWLCDQEGMTCCMDDKPFYAMNWGDFTEVFWVKRGWLPLFKCKAEIALHTHTRLQVWTGICVPEEWGW
jgi:RHS repeat-associated protein